MSKIQKSDQQSKHQMYDKKRVLENIKMHIRTSLLGRTMKQSGYDLTRLNGDYNRALYSMFTSRDEDDPLIYMILVLDDIFKDEGELSIDDIENIHHDTFDTFKECIKKHF